MSEEISKIQQALIKYDLKLSPEEIQKFLGDIQAAQQYFPLSEQRALIIRLLYEWDMKKTEKIITLNSEACYIKHGPCVTTFGILGIDWPGFFDTCVGIIHEMGWNIYFVKGFYLTRRKENLGIILIGIKTEGDDSYNQLHSQRETILSKIHQAAVGTSAKTYLLSEEIRKLTIFK